MSQAANGDTVRVHYKGTLDDGSEFDSSDGHDPIEVTIGAGEVIRGFEDALVGLTPGDKKTVTLPSDDAYGPHVPEMVQKVDRVQIPAEVPLEQGGILNATGPDGEQVRLVVTEVTDSTVTLDANHPLAGEDLTFELELVEIL